MSTQRDPDPRIERTVIHVEKCVRQLLAEAGPAGTTFTSVARVARVSRQTLYVHWETPERLIAAAVLGGYTGGYPHDEPTIEAAARAWFESVSGALGEPTRSVAFSTLMAYAAHDDSVRTSLETITTDRYRAFSEMLARFEVTVSEDDFAFVSGPIFYSLFLRQRAPSADLIDRVVASVVSLANPVPNTTSPPKQAKHPAKASGRLARSRKA